MSQTNPTQMNAQSKPTTQKYRDRMLEHLSSYKVGTLGVEGCGEWRKKPYGHILPSEPEGSKWLNILGPYRDEFRAHAAEKHIHLHRDFAHLNSSQAMCFNLFFPFMAEPGGMAMLADVLNLDAAVVEGSAEFEKVFPDFGETTNFDFFFQTASGRALFEVKLTESHFGSVDAEEYEGQYTNLYQGRLEGRIAATYQNREAFCRHYQICRNIWNLEPGDNLFFVLPRASEALKAEARLIREIAAPEVADRVRVVHLEALLRLIRRAVAGRARMAQHFRLFTEKYLSTRPR